MPTRTDLSEAEYEAAFSAFQAAVARAPGQVAFANICRCSQGNVSQLLGNRSLLPERFVLRVSQAVGIAAHILRPDIYPPSDDDAAVTEPAFKASYDRAPVSQRGAA